MAAATTPIRARPATAAPVRRIRRPAVTKQAAEQRRAYAATVLRALARTQASRPVTQVRELLRDALSPSGSASPRPGWAQLAADLTAGRLVTLP